jgi:hypothetical protein
MPAVFEQFLNVLATHSEQIWNAIVGVGAAIFITFLGIILLRLVKKQFGEEEWKNFLKSNFAFLYGIPASATAAFGLVVFFGVTSPGQMELKVLSFEASGPAGPALMFVIVFLAFIIAIFALRPK